MSKLNYNCEGMYNYRKVGLWLWLSQLPPTPEICGSNPIIGDLCLLSTVLKLQNKDESGRDWPHFEKGPNLLLVSSDGNQTHDF